MEKTHEIPLDAAHRWQVNTFARQVRIEGHAQKSPCPCCGGHDRFVIKPRRDNPALALIHCFRCNLRGERWRDVRDAIRGGPAVAGTIPRVMRVYKPKPYERPKHPDGREKRLIEMTRHEQVMWKRNWEASHSRHIEEARRASRLHRKQNTQRGPDHDPGTTP